VPTRRRLAGGSRAAELVEREHPLRDVSAHVLDPGELVSRCGSLDSFHVLVRWKVIRCRCKICRSRSCPISIGRVAREPR